jgi:hypothetical protein
LLNGDFVGYVPGGKTGRASGFNYFEALRVPTVDMIGTLTYADCSS